MKNPQCARIYCASSYIFNSTSRRLRAAALAAMALAACGGAQAQQPFFSEMRAFAFGYCPRGWAPADGRLLAVNTNQAMFALVGTTYGGNGVDTFGLPDLRGRTPLGQGISPQGGSYARGQQDGQEFTTLTTTQMPAHTHAFIATTAPATHAAPTAGAQLAQAQNAGLYVDSAAADTTLTTAPAGGNQAFTTRDPYLAITWCVSIVGIFPSSN